MFSAIVFDFDGLILDTESPALSSWQEQFAALGLTLDLEAWMSGIGTVSGFDGCAEIERMLGEPVDRQAVRQRRASRYEAMLAAEVARPGVLAYLAEAANLGLRLGVASSSRRSWVTGHLEALGIAGYFDVVCGRDDVGGVPKPAPDVYLAVLDRLGVPAQASLALEDSAHGVRAAKAAGMWCVHVPNDLTRMLPCGDADLCVESMAEMPLSVLIERVRGPGGSERRPALSWGLP